MAVKPQVRAAWVQQLLRSTRGLPARQYIQVARALDDRLKARIMNEVRVGWLESQHHMDLLHLLDAELTEAAFDEFHQKTCLAILQSAFLQDLVVSGAKVFGDRLLVRVFPRVWGHVWRGHGTVDVEQTDHETLLTFERMPDELVGDPVYQKSVLHLVHGMLEAGQIDSHVDQDASDAHENTLRFLVPTPNT